MPSLTVPGPMPRDQQFVGSPLAQHLDSHQHRRHNHGMKTVHSDCLHRMQPLDWLAIFLGERDVSPNVPNRAT